MTESVAGCSGQIGNDLRVGTAALAKVRCDLRMLAALCL
jgi:hypothetical protein